MIPLGLNAGALALLGALLTSLGEPGGFVARWTTWVVPGAAALALGTLAFRFPRTAGLGLAAALALGVWFVAGQLAPFQPVTGVAPEVRVQPLTDRDLVVAFSRRLDEVEVPRLPGVPSLWIRITDSGTRPTEPWWPWVEAQGWARSFGAAVPPQALKFGVYRLDPVPNPPVWRLVHPALETTQP